MSLARLGQCAVCCGALLGWGWHFRMACGAAEQLGVVWWVVWVVWGCGLALGGLSFLVPGPRGRVRSREEKRAKKRYVRRVAGEKGARVPESRPGAARFRNFTMRALGKGAAGGCRNPGRVRLDLEF